MTDTHTLATSERPAPDESLDPDAQATLQRIAAVALANRRAYARAQEAKRLAAIASGVAPASATANPSRAPVRRPAPFRSRQRRGVSPFYNPSDRD